MNIGEYDFMWTYVFISFGLTYRSGIDGSYGKSIFVRNVQTGLQNDHTFYVPLKIQGPAHITSPFLLQNHKHVIL